GFDSICCAFLYKEDHLAASADAASLGSMSTEIFRVRTGFVASSFKACLALAIFAGVAILCFTAPDCALTLASFTALAFATGLEAFPFLTADFAWADFTADFDFCAMRSPCQKDRYYRIIP